MIFPGVADLFFLPLSLARPEKAYRLALVATDELVDAVGMLWLTRPDGWLADAIAKGPAPKVVTAQQIKPEPVISDN